MASIATLTAEPTIAEQFRAAVIDGRALPSIGPAPGTWSPDYPRWRFLNLLQRAPEPTLDHGVLLRQAVRSAGNVLFVGAWTPSLAAVGGACGVRLTPAGDLVTTGYQPGWLTDEDWAGGHSLDEPPIPALPDETLPAEPWLWSLGHGDMRSWHSPAQKEACWHALTAPAGATTLIGLPTGAGKSLAFQLVARFSAGVTIVVVPTTALAIDQCIAAKALLAGFPHLGPRYYSSDDPGSDPAMVRAALKDGSCRLLFASPESCVSGSLRAVLDELAAAGRIDTLVVDEAHIIDSWGGHFRVDFQLLALRRRQWLAASQGRMRTLLLSATFTPRCLELLRSMFGSGEWRQFACQRLRPEISYFRNPFFSADDRERALLEALHHLPRPLIVYVTEVAEAQRIRDLLVDAGFASTECFHGDTPGSERRRLLLEWRANRIEIMVATSAFGMGVDKADVRAVVHACYPESVHRYYQEVGRGGRDGAKSIALWMPLMPRDRAVATGLLPTMLGPDLIALRWKTMLDAGSDEEDGVLSLPTNAKHQRLMGGRSYGENIRWNKRLLLMMTRAGLIDLVDLSFEADDAEPDGRVERVLLRCRFVPSDPKLATRLQAPRSAEMTEARAGVDAMASYLDGTAKVCRLLRRAYGAETIIACGGCFACRGEVFDRFSVPILDFDPLPPTSPRLEIVATEWYSTGGTAMAVLFDQLVDLVSEHRVRQIVCTADLLAAVTEGMAERISPAGRHLYRLDGAGETAGFSVEPGDHVVAIHGRVPDRSLLRLRAGARISHLFPRDAVLVDGNDRVLLTHDGARFFPTLDAWRAQI